MGNEWKYERLVDCTVDGSISYGIVQPGKKVSDGVPIVRVNNLVSEQFSYEDVRKVAPEIESSYKRTRLNGGEVLLSLVGSTGQSMVVPDEMKGWNVARAIAVIKPKPNIGSRWINICLQSKPVQHFLDTRANTTVQKTLNLKDVKQVLIPIPSKREKSFIESAIGTLDDKIALNRQQNATLEAMAQALFRSWFVDFDPVLDKALAAGHDIPEPLQAKAQRRLALGDQRKPLPPEVAGLFPDRFVYEEEVGWVPEGWGVKAIGDLLESISQKYPLEDADKVVFLNTGDIQSGSFLHQEYSETKGLPGQAKKSIEKGDILYSEIRPKNKRYAYVYFDAKEYVVSTKLMVLRSKSNVDNLFLYFLLTQQDKIDHLQMLAESRSGTFPQITFSILSKIKTLLPSNLEIIEYFTHEVLRTYHDKTIENLNQNESLINLRDTLLPKLISGELRVQEAETLIEKES